MRYPMATETRPIITVLAGVNGAGKTSIGGAHLRENGGEYFNPDEVATALIAAQPGLAQAEANALAWHECKRRLQAAIAENEHFVFETTLGGNSITRILKEAAIGGALLNVWYAGLESVELHIKRVAARVGKGGHHIPEMDIRKRWSGSHQNLIRLIPWVTTLRIYDNSLERDPSAGLAPEPRLLLAIDEKSLTHPTLEDLPHTPHWAKPLVFHAFQHFRLMPPTPGGNGW